MLKRTMDAPFHLDVLEPGNVRSDSASWRQEFRREVMRLQENIRATPGSTGDDPFPLKHTFAPGVYAREITLPAGSICVGKIHKHAHHNFITRGKVRVLTESGPMEYTAPVNFVSEVGTKRIVYAIEETVWTTIHATNETDLEKIEEQIIAKDYAELDALTHKREALE